MHDDREPTMASSDVAASLVLADLAKGHSMSDVARERKLPEPLVASLLNALALRFEDKPVPVIAGPTLIEGPNDKSPS